MNLLNNLKNNDIELLQKAGLSIENREYTREELKQCESTIENFIMSHSIKNGEINRISNEYAEILDMIIKGE